jgi:thiol-disulfide isomerase/thioredoxin
MLAALALGGVWLIRQPGQFYSHQARASAGEDDPETTALKPVTMPPEFPPGAEWLQSKPIKLADLRGRVVIVHFWTFGCSNCIHNYPVYKIWQEKYPEKDLTIVGVHTPEFAHEANGTRVETKARENGLKFPIVIDNDQAIWNRWNNRYWPSVYLIDRQGRLRYHWEGELHLAESAGRKFAGRIDELLAEKP